ncbi:phage portal protein [Herbaspirillum frisingense]|uniref:phage portal protein n=1 Tax=Herbaspirillum frisingense TaxID=92645 RepID=UPI0039B0120C
MNPNFRKPSLLQRLAEWAGNRTAQAIWAGRLRHAPDRATAAYAKLVSIGGKNYNRNQPMIKPTPANLRRFAKTPYARRAINRIKAPVAALGWEVGVKKGVEETAEHRRQIEIVKRCFERPNNDDSFRTMIEQVTEDLLVCGAGAIEQELGGKEIRPLWMWPVDALSIDIYIGWSGAKNEARYSQSIGPGNVASTRGIPLLNDQLIYIRKDPTSSDPFGTGPLEVAFSTINRLLATADYAGNVAGNSQPANMIQFKGMDQVSLDRFREWWRNEVEGQGTTPLIGGDEAKVHPLRGTTDDALYLKYQEFLIREIATAFELSPGSLGVEADVNRNTAEVADEREWSAAIIPMASNIASYLNREAIEGKLGFSQIEFRWLGVDRDDESLQAEIHKSYYEMNALTPNEIREKLGRKPSLSQWADLCAADVEIAKVAARGVARDVDKDLQPDDKPSKQPSIEKPDEPGTRGRSGVKRPRGD